MHAATNAAAHAATDATANAAASAVTDTCQAMRMPLQRQSKGENFTGSCMFTGR